MPQVRGRDPEPDPHRWRLRLGRGLVQGDPDRGVEGGRAGKIIWEPATLFYTNHVRKFNGNFSFRILLGIVKNNFLSFTEGILGGPCPLQKSKFQFSYTHRVAIQKWL